jgi:uncharacterized protein YbaR (Trm112 family)
MPVDSELISILVCPETGQPVKLADASVLERLNAAVDAGSLRTRGGAPVAKRLQEGLLREDGKVLYPVEDGIPVMLTEDSIELTGTQATS